MNTLRLLRFIIWIVCSLCIISTLIRLWEDYIIISAAEKYRASKLSDECIFCPIRHPTYLLPISNNNNNNNNNNINNPHAGHLCSRCNPTELIQNTALFNCMNCTLIDGFYLNAWIKHFDYNMIQHTIAEWQTVFPSFLRRSDSVQAIATDFNEFSWIVLEYKIVLAAIRMTLAIAICYGFIIIINQNNKKQIKNNNNNNNNNTETQQEPQDSEANGFKPLDPSYHFKPTNWDLTPSTTEGVPYQRNNLGWYGSTTGTIASIDPVNAIVGSTRSNNSGSAFRSVNNRNTGREHVH